MTHRYHASFWPIQVPRSSRGHVAANLRGGTGRQNFGLIGGTGGLWRFSQNRSSDKGADFESWVVYGPVFLGDEFNTGSLLEITATMAHNSGDVEFEI